LFHNGDYSKADLLGIDNLQRSIVGVYRIIVRFLEPDFLIRKSARLWTTFVSEGSIEVERTGSKALTLRVVGLRSPHVAWCHNMRGSWEGALLACNARSPAIQHVTCVLDGAPECTYSIAWC
jgi:hypothetical protein